ncbi:Frag1/DRAM/Sfk1 family-domain-containing protein [Tirmania nivea]|nr:Frag1/DRAM/Sfk1 family-domain-containing protein [Tirmania nivea]
MARLFNYRPNNGPYWILPLISASMWFSMLWAMLIVYLAQGHPRYTSQEANTLAFISDIGAGVLKPLFITGTSITSTFFLLSLLSMRRNQALPKRKDRVLDLCALLFGLFGSVSLILLSVFDTARHSNLHRLFLLFFMLGIVLSALFTTLEYRSLGKSFTTHPVLKYSYVGKAVLLIVEGGLSIGFAVCLRTHRATAGAALEWVIAFIFTLYVLTFFFDLRPKARTKSELATEKALSEGMSKGRAEEEARRAGGEEDGNSSDEERGEGRGGKTQTP